MRRKLFFLGLGVLLLAGAAVVWLIFGKKQTEIIKKEEVKKETTQESEEKSKKLETLENAIERTKKELEAISALSAEEKAERARKRTILSAQKETDDVSVDGVEVVISGAKKIVVNKKEGYRIEIPVNLLIARSVTSDWIEFHDKKFMCQDPSCEPIMRIRVLNNNPNEFAIGEWLKKEEEKAGAPIYSPRELLAIGQESVYRVVEEIPARFEGFYYYWNKGKKIYDIRISVFNDAVYHPYINTFSFLTVP